MTTPTLFQPATTVERVFTPELDIKRSARIITGRAVPYGVAERVSDDGLTSYMEEFKLGVFERSALPANTGRVKLNYTHGDDTSLFHWIGRTMKLWEEADGLYGEWKVDESSFGDAVLYKVNDDQLGGLSVSASISETLKRGDVVVRAAGHLRHVALVEQGAYSDAKVLAMRAKHVEDQAVDIIAPSGPLPAIPRRRGDDLRARVASLR